MRKWLAYLVLAIAVCGLVIVFSKTSEKGDYILEKQLNSNDVPTLFVVYNISKKEAKTKSLSDFLNNDDQNDVMIIHVDDKDLYNDLKIGERVTIKTKGYTMLSSPPQAVADEIIRYS
ncbi:DUF3221 domain-containing protein [Bacillus sp. FJAT-28004]|uniref:DUF3221 domain-containing protein n=1 Tax=Bacillus sp. FJAT-28004 TaxID=1679165 RepID=UPI0006B4037F|nr:DUF3221 domain-containing protein [Bacillus sp. FJAT-28004]